MLTFNLESWLLSLILQMRQTEAPEVQLLRT